MSAPEQEKSRWGLILAGLAVAGGVVWFDWSSREVDSSASIVQPASNAATRATDRRDFVADLNARGVASTINPVASVSKTLLTDTINRPLFTATRRQPISAPPAAIPPPAPPPPPDPRALQLVGVMVGKDGEVALVRLRGQRRSQSVRTGEIIAGWTVKEITSRSMRVSKADVEATIGVASNKGRPGRARFRAPPGSRNDPARQPAAAPRNLPPHLRRLRQNQGQGARMQPGPQQFGRGSER